MGIEKNLIMNKKAGSYAVWIEILVIVVLFAGALAIIGSNFNTKYGKSYDYSFGLATNETQQQLQDYSASLETDIKGEAGATSFLVLTLSTLPKIMIGVTTLIWNFVSGAFIHDVVELMNLGEYSSLIIAIFRTLYFIAIGFILIKIITKITP